MFFQTGFTIFRFNVPKTLIRTNFNLNKDQRAKLGQNSQKGKVFLGQNTLVQPSLGVILGDKGLQIESLVIQIGIPTILPSNFGLIQNPSTNLFSRLRLKPDFDSNKLIFDGF